MKSPATLFTLLFGILFFVVVSESHAAWKSKSDELKESYQEMFQSQDSEQIVEHLFNIFTTDKANQNLDAFGETIAIHADKALSIFKVLDQQNSTQATSLKAELLLWMARGDETPRWKREDRDFTPNPMDLHQVGELAAPLLQHDDPFVRGLAEFAISVGVSLKNLDRTQIWPTDTGPQWYSQWNESLKPEYLLESDYVRQGALLGIHRTPETLIKNANEIVNRLEGPVQAIRQQGDADQKQVAETHLKQVHSILDHMKKSSANNITQLRKQWLELRHAARNIVMANPAFDFDRILMATRHAYHDGPNITAGAKSYIIKPGGDIFIKKGLHPQSSVKPLINGQLESGHMRGMELWWDAGRLVFAYAEQPEYFDKIMYESDQGFADKKHGYSEPVHLYEMNIDGSGLEQITSHEYQSDVEPTYLPNGDIVFCSDRSNFGSQCSGHFFQNKKIVNLYRISPDGTNPRAISNNKDFDRYPHVLDNGLLVFTRWEYQERHLWQTHNVWTAHPDGTMSDAIYKQHIDSGPMALRDVRHIPGSDKMIAIACGHHEFAQGAVTLIDHHQGINNHEGMRLVTPKISPREGGLGRGKPVESGGIQDNGGLYQQPYALSENGFLVSYSYHLPRSQSNAGNFGLYYIDVWGNKELIHREPVLSVVYPIPLKPRKQPPIIPDKIDESKQFASVYATDVHSGVPEVEPGTIKYIRISHRTEWPVKQTGDRVVDFNHLHYTPSGSWARTLGVWTWTPARVIGTIPVEDDGSAHFKVPSNIPLYFQALDENYMEVRRMRTFAIFQPGEMRGCTGCHETRDETPLSSYRMPKAVSRMPSRPVPPSWSARELPDYERHIQPIISKYCASCHDQHDPAGGLDFTDRKVDGYCQSYRTMFGLGPEEPTPFWEPWTYNLFYPNDDPAVQDKDALKAMEKNQYPGQLISISNRFSGAEISEPYQFGSHKSKLITTLLQDDHRKNVNMKQQEWIDLVTWVDLNAPYWGSFVDKEPARDDKQPKRIRVFFPEPFISHYPSELDFSEKLTPVYEKSNE